MKKALIALGGVLGSVAAFAQDSTGGSSSVDIDLTEATTALTGLQTALVDWVGDAMPILTAIAGAFLVFWLGKMVFRLVKGWTSAAK